MKGQIQMEALLLLLGLVMVAAAVGFAIKTGASSLGETAVSTPPPEETNTAPYGLENIEFKSEVARVIMKSEFDPSSFAL